MISVVKCRPGLQKISIIGHSLGGLVARYAIARLYGRDINGQIPLRKVGSWHGEIGDLCKLETCKGKIVGLEPMNFVTSATPHLGSRGHKQVNTFENESCLCCLKLLFHRVQYFSHAGCSSDSWSRNESVVHQCVSGSIFLWSSDP